jgi:RNA polymerase sigma-70 factor (ECF subfamily)
LERLPRKYRDAVILYHFLDKDVEKAARILSVAAGTLKSRLHRGRELLRRRLSARLLPQPAAKEV